jgi:hypothetical protein
MLSIEQIKAACSRSEPVLLGDPVSRCVDLPLHATFYPMGFPVEIATNSEDILDAAKQSWGRFKRLFDTQPIELRIGVTEGNSSECPPAPVCRVQRNLLSHIADSENFAICDIAEGFCTMSLTRAAVEHRSYLRFYFLEATVLCQITTRYTTPIHAACVELDGRGVLLCGDSGAGKSTLAYACAQAGWTYITDDASYVLNNREDRLAVGNCTQVRLRPSAVDFFPELNGREVTRRADVGKPSIELCTSPFHNIARSHTSHIEYVVFINRREVTHQEVVPFSREVARFFMQQPLFSMPKMLELQNTVIDRLLGTQVLELKYRDLDWAIGRLTSLVKDGR